MAKYRKRPIEVEASRWFKNGDHPNDNSVVLGYSPGTFLSEGAVVRRYRRPDVPETGICPRCGATMGLHGWIDTLECGHTVCPGDWIITGIKGEMYPCKDEVFRLTYELVVQGSYFEIRGIADVDDIDVAWRFAVRAHPVFIERGWPYDIYGTKRIPKIRDLAHNVLSLMQTAGNTTSGHVRVRRDGDAWVVTIEE